MTSKSSSLVLLLALSLVLIGSMSVVGLLQSTERVSSSGIIIQPPPPLPDPPTSPPTQPPPPEPTVEIDVYSDAGCTVEATDIEWGSVEAGNSVNRVIFIKNAGESGVTLSLSTQNWSPPTASDDIQLTWNYDGSTLNPGSVREVILTLSVSPNISGIDTFSFDIVLTGEAT